MIVFVWRHGVGRVGLPAAISVAVLLASGCGVGESRKVRETFFAVADEATQLVEADVATGEIVRTVVDVRRADGGFVAIDGLEIAPDRRAAFYSLTAEGGRASVYRVALPNGTPEQLTDGTGPSVSPDGTQLAFVAGTTLHVRDLRTSEDRTFPGAIGDLGGSDTTWAPDGRHLAFAVHAADSVGGTGSVDTASGEPVDPQPAAADPSGIYAAYSARYRPGDGDLAVICCEHPNLELDDPSHGRSLVLHDPVTGAERDRLSLPFRGGSFAFAPSGEEAIFTSFPDGHVYRFRGGTFRRVPGLAGIVLLDW